VILDGPGGVILVGSWRSDPGGVILFGSWRSDPGCTIILFYCRGAEKKLQGKVVLVVVVLEVVLVAAVVVVLIVVLLSNFLPEYSSDPPGLRAAPGRRTEPHISGEPSWSSGFWSPGPGVRVAGSGVRVVQVAGCGVRVAGSRGPGS